MDLMPASMSRQGDLREIVASELERARARSLDLLEPVPEHDLIRQHSPLMSPLVWDLAHVGNYEDIWLLRSLDAEGVGARYDEIYDAFRHPRKSRPSLPLLGPADARRYIASVRARVVDVLERVPFDPERPLLADGFVYGMVVQHEHQHDETMLATLQLMDGTCYRPTAALPPKGAPIACAEVRVEGGAFVMGTDTDAWGYDNERPAHEVHVDPFWIDTVPVTNAAYAEFIAAGGYHERRWWTDAGWNRRRRDELEQPAFWRHEGGESWSRMRLGWREPLSPDEPVQHVSWYEADAYARFRGRRLPTEPEWEKAAAWDPRAGRARRYPWGDDPPDESHANLNQRHFRPAPVGAYPSGASAYGCLQMIGDVWEWTASDFTAYPGFRAFPYREYSEVFHGTDYKVLRGGSWATHPRAVRNTFRNWDYPIRRQIFAGFRCARDA
jgi:iron(II)-dependent oxidoreductase